MMTKLPLFVSAYEDFLKSARSHKKSTGGTKRDLNRTEYDKTIEKISEKIYYKEIEHWYFERKKEGGQERWCNLANSILWLVEQRKERYHEEEI